MATIDVRADTSAYDKAMKDVAKTGEKTAGQVEDSFSKAFDGAGAAAFADHLLDVGSKAVEAAQAIAEFSKEVIDNRNMLADMEVTTGVAANTLQGLRLGAAAAGMEFSELQEIVKVMPLRLSEVAAGSGAAAGAFAKLGVDATNADGSLRDADTVLRELTSALAGIESDEEKASLAMQAFGESGAKLLPIIGNNADALQAFSGFANEWGISTGPKAVKAAQDMQLQFAVLETTVDGLKDRFFDAAIGAENGFKVIGQVVVFAGTLVTEVVRQMREDLGDFAASFTALADAKGPAELGAALKEVGVQVAKNIGPGRALVQVWETAGAAGTAWARAEDWAGSLDLLTDSISNTTTETSSFVATTTSAAGSMDDAALAAIAEAEAIASLGKIALKSRQDLVTESGKIVSEMSIELEAIQAIEDKYGALPGLVEARYEVESRAARELSELNTELNNKAAQEQQTRMAADEAERQARVSGGISAANTFLTGLSQISTLAAEAQASATGKAAERLVALSKASAVVQIAINTAVAITQALAQLGPIAGAAAAIGITAVGAVQAGTVLAQDVPSFHTGTSRMPDESNALVLQREAVVTSAGVQTAGGPEAIDRLNRGQPIDHSPAPTFLVMGTQIFNEAYKRVSGLANNSIRSGIRHQTGMLAGVRNG